MAGGSIRARLLRLVGGSTASILDKCPGHTLEAPLLAIEHALEVIDAIDLTDHEETALLEETNLDAWEQLAPVTRDLIRMLMQTLKEIEGALDPMTAELAAMLRNRVMEFGRALARPGTVANAWVLLDEIFRFKSECSEGLEAMVGMLLSATLAIDAPDLPREQRRRHQHKAAVLHLQRLRAAMDTPPEENHREVLRLVREFYGSPSFDTFPPSRRSPTLRFLRAAKSWPKAYAPEVGEAIEDFARAIELLLMWNQQAIAQLEQSGPMPATSDIILE